METLERYLGRNFALYRNGARGPEEAVRAAQVGHVQETQRAMAARDRRVTELERLSFHRELTPEESDEYLELVHGAPA